MISSSPYVGLGLATLVLLAIRLAVTYSPWRSRALPLPPGPKGLPLIGNLHQLPPAFPWKQYYKWCREYDTDILYLNLAGTNVIVLNSAKVTTDLLESRSSLYSGRPRFAMVNELMGWDFNFGFGDYGDSWRKHRKLMHQSFHPAAAKQFRPYITKSTRNALKRFVEEPEPEKIIPHLRYMAGETILSFSYGIEIQAKDDPYIKTSTDGVHPLMAAGVPGAFLVDAFPILKNVPAWFPGASFQVKAREWRALARRMLEMPYAAAKEAIEAGKYTISFVGENLRRIETGLEKDPEHETIIKNVAGTMYGAGADTTVAAIATGILALLEHPEVLKRAQAELDGVIKRGHLPEIDDKSSLPYVTAVVKETLRWREVAPIGVPHFLKVEDEYMGYRLPAGSVVIGSPYALLHDERVYEDPFAFNPDRFIDPATGNLDFTHAQDPEHACWGFGRRICPGRYMAFDVVWLAIASLIYCFDLEKTAELTHEYVPALVHMPMPFECSIRPRSAEKEELIRSGESSAED